MSRTTQDPIAVAKMALEAGRKALPDYSCPKSPHKFTQPQLFAMLVLKSAGRCAQFFKRDYRGTVTWLSKWSELRSTLGITKVPHFRTLHEAARRLLKKGAAYGVAPVLLQMRSGLVVCLSGRPGFFLLFSADEGKTWSIPHWVSESNGPFGQSASGYG